MVLRNQFNLERESSAFTKNESSNLGRLSSLIRNLNCSKSLEAYDKVMQDQIREGIVERVTESEKSIDIQNSEKLFYLPQASHP